MCGWNGFFWVVIILPLRNSFITSAARGSVFGIWQPGENTKNPSLTEVWLSGGVVTINSDAGDDDDNEDDDDDDDSDDVGEEDALNRICE